MATEHLSLQINQTPLDLVWRSCCMHKVLLVQPHPNIQWHQRKRISYFEQIRANSAVCTELSFFSSMYLAEFFWGKRWRTIALHISLAWHFQNPLPWCLARANILQKVVILWWAHPFSVENWPVQRDMSRKILTIQVSTVHPDRTQFWAP